MAANQLGYFGQAVSTCQNCGQVIGFGLNQGQFGHICSRPDPRIMAELTAIKEILQDLRKLLDERK